MKTRRDVAVPCRVVLISLSVLALACGARRSDGDRARAPASEESAADSSAAAASFYGGDVEKLRVNQPGDTVLVRAGAAPYITADQYNAWLGTYPLSIKSVDPTAARREALEQMVTFRLLVQKARDSGYRPAPDGQGLDDKSMVITYIRDHVTSIGGVTEEQARDYESRHQAELAQLDASGLPAEARTMAVRGSVRGEQLWDQVKSWMEARQIRYEEEALR